MNETASHPPDELSLTAFLRALTDEGVAVVSPNLSAPSENAEISQHLRVWAAALSSELPGHAPELRIDAALWAVRMLYQVSRFVVCRDIGEPEIVKALAEKCPEPRSAAVDWSVDLAFRNLPEILRTAHQFSNADPLVRELRELAAQWPLSSVGISDLRALDIEPFIAHPALRQLYVDRILTANDVTRVNDPRVIETIRETLGGHPELCPTLATRVFASEEPALVGPS